VGVLLQVASHRRLPKGARRPITRGDPQRLGPGPVRHCRVPLESRSLEGVLSLLKSRWRCILSRSFQNLSETNPNYGHDKMICFPVRPCPPLVCLVVLICPVPPPLYHVPPARPVVAASRNGRLVGYGCGWIWTRVSIGTNQRILSGIGESALSSGTMPARLVPLAASIDDYHPPIRPSNEPQTR
jgi:hypothetical protein